MKLNGDIPRHPIAEWIRFISAVLIIPLFAFMLGWTLTIDRRLTAIEASRFNADDGLEVWKELGRKANATDVPNIEVRQRLTNIEEDIKEMRRLMNDILMQQQRDTGGSP